MRIRQRSGMTVALLCLVSASGTVQAADYDFTNLTRMIDDAVRTMPLEGASLLVLRDGVAIYEQTFGSYTAATTVSLTSATKWISASVIMTLVDDGVLSLESRASDYIPEFSGEKAGITLRQLLSHTSGLPSRNPCITRSSITLGECAASIGAAALADPPGTVFRYSDCGYVVAGRMAEVATGKPWKQLFEERIKGPLGWTTTAYNNGSNPRIGGGARSNLHEYARLLQMELDGGVWAGKRVLSASAVAEMQKDQTFGVPFSHTIHTDGRRYGLGQWRDIVGSNGEAIQLSSQGITGFSPWIDTQRRLAAVFLVNNELDRVYGLVEQIQAEVRRVVDSAGTGTPKYSYDYDGDGSIGAGDLSLLSCCWLLPAGATGCGGQRACDLFDVDCDGSVGPGDLSYFSTGWQKAVGAVGIQFPDCR